MRKYFFVVFFALLVVLVGCGNKNQVKCTGEMNEGGMKIKAEVVADLDGDNKVKDATIVYDLGDAKAAETYCSIFKMMEDAEKGISVSCSGSKITIKGAAQMDEGDEKIVGSTKDDFVKAMEAEGLTCK